MVINEEWFYDTNLTDGAIFLMSLIKRKKSKNQLKNLPCDTNQHIWGIAMYNGWNTHIFQILRGEHDGKFISNEIF